VKLLPLLTPCLVGAALIASSARADEAVVAKLQTPVRQSAKFLAGEAVFICADDVCRAASPMSQTFAMATCKAIVAKFGPVVAFAGRRAFEPDRLALCNAGAAPRQTAAEGAILR
jgi:hypothetical protein